jgi:hypothetical protein
MKLSARLRKQWLAKKARSGFRGYPVGTVIFYGPDDQRVTKAAVGVVRAEGAETEMRRWSVTDGDIRNDQGIAEEMAAHLRDNEVRTVTTMDRIFGCPHEEGIDYPEGESCPHCPFWKGRDRYTGELEEE